MQINYVKENIQMETVHFYDASLFRIRFQVSQNDLHAFAIFFLNLVRRNYKWFAIGYKDFLNLDA